MTKNAWVTTAPASRSRWAAARAVPPVAIRSSTMATLWPGRIAVGSIQPVRAIFQVIVDAQRCHRQLARLAHRHAQPSARAAAAPKMKPRASMPAINVAPLARTRAAR
jgi:hypothetical protein